MGCHQGQERCRFQISRVLCFPCFGSWGDGKDRSTAEMRERIAGDLKLTPDELAERLEEQQLCLANRLAWAVAKLKEAEILACLDGASTA